MAERATQFRLRPRWPWLAPAVFLFGSAIVIHAIVTLPGSRTQIIQIATGVAIQLFSAAFHYSPIWRSVVVVTSSGLSIQTKRGVRISFEWREVKRVVANRERKVALIDVGEAQRNFVIPGAGMSTPYRIERAVELYELVMSHCRDVVEWAAEEQFR